MNNQEDFCILPETTKLRSDSKTLEKDFQRYLVHHFGRFRGCSPYYLYEALSLTIRERVISDWRETWVHHKHRKARRYITNAPAQDAPTICRWNSSSAVPWVIIC